MLGCIPVTKTVFDTVVTNLPEPQEGVTYLTSTLVAQLCRTELMFLFRQTFAATRQAASLVAERCSVSSPAKVFKRDSESLFFLARKKETIWSPSE